MRILCTLLAILSVACTDTTRVRYSGNRAFSGSWQRPLRVGPPMPSNSKSSSTHPTNRTHSYVLGLASTGCSATTRVLMNGSRSHCQRRGRH